MSTCVPWCKCGDQRSTWKVSNTLPLQGFWGGIQVASLASKTFTHGVISMTLNLSVIPPYSYICPEE